MNFLRDNNKLSPTEELTMVRISSPAHLKCKSVEKSLKLPVDLHV